jgi:hypothetical protein
MTGVKQVVVKKKKKKIKNNSTQQDWPFRPRVLG